MPRGPKIMQENFEDDETELLKRKKRAARGIEIKKHVDSPKSHNHNTPVKKKLSVETALGWIFAMVVFIVAMIYATRSEAIGKEFDQKTSKDVGVKQKHPPSSAPRNKDGSFAEEHNLDTKKAAHSISPKIDHNDKSQHKTGFFSNAANLFGFSSQLSKPFNQSAQAYRKQNARDPHVEAVRLAFRTEFNGRRCGAFDPPTQESLRAFFETNERSLESELESQLLAILDGFDSATGVAFYVPRQVKEIVNCEGVASDRCAMWRAQSDIETGDFTPLRVARISRNCAANYLPQMIRSHPQLMDMFQS